MTVAELIKKLEKMPQDAEVWTAASYSKGRKPFTTHPTAEVLCLNPRGNPVYKSDKRYMNHAERWVETAEVVGL